MVIIRTGKNVARKFLAALPVRRRSQWEVSIKEIRESYRLYEVVVTGDISDWECLSRFFVDRLMCVIYEKWLEYIVALA